MNIDNINQLQNKAIEKFVSHEKETVFKVGIDNQGRKYLQAVNKKSLNFLWFWIASKILHLEDYQFKTVVTVINRNVIFNKKEKLNEKQEQFYELITSKIQKFNESRKDNQQIKRVINRSTSKTKEHTIEAKLIKSEQGYQGYAEEDLCFKKVSLGFVEDKLLMNRNKEIGSLWYNPKGKKYVLLFNSNKWKRTYGLGRFGGKNLNIATIEDIKKEYNINTILLPNGKEINGLINWHWFPPIYQLEWGQDPTMTSHKELIKMIKKRIVKEVENYNDAHKPEERLKIAFDGDKILLGYNPTEFKDLLKKNHNLKNLRKHFTSDGQNIHLKYSLQTSTNLMSSSKEQIRELM